jgi:hypothetical protein
MLWFTCGLLLGLTVLSMSKAAVPLKSRVTDDTAIYQKLSEIKVRKQMKVDFDSDLSRLSSLESRYRERLPSLANHPQMRAAMKRISQQRYR